MHYSLMEKFCLYQTTTTTTAERNMAITAADAADAVAILLRYIHVDSLVMLLAVVMLAAPTSAQHQHQSISSNISCSIRNAGDAHLTCPREKERDRDGTKEREKTR